MPSEVSAKKGEPIDKALRRLKKKLDREGVLRELRTAYSQHGNFPKVPRR